MHGFFKSVPTVAMTCLALAIAGCSDHDSNTPVDTAADNDTVLAANSPAVGGASAETTRIDLNGSDSALAAVFGASEIPYPVYPNGQKYRVGGENGLKIVVFQTDDEFDQVDEYYSQFKENTGMARLMAMQDYVRYANNDSEADPWATHEPGIVIHQFNDAVERRAVGASPTARTNIIMSF